jgi:hypothetical protein
MARIYIFLLALSLTGCSILFPKKTEYFQDKVREMPSQSATHKEVQKEAAAFVADKTKQTVRAALDEKSSTNVLKPAIEAEVVADSLSGSIGKPLDPWEKSAKLLAERLDHLDAKLSEKLEDFREANDKNAGKKIEGTGLIQVGYFTQLLILAVLGIGAWLVIKVLGIFNPAVQVGSQVLSGGVRGVGKIVKKGFTEVIKAGESFKEKVDQEFEDPETRERILALFSQAHKENQSSDVQEVIKKLTNPDVK